jgi:Flp pilus assembly protein TadD
MKSAETSALVNASRELLHQNDADGAHRVLAPIISRLGNNPEALHLMGLIKRTLGHLDEAERYLRSAVAYSLDEGGYYNDLAVVLQALGQREEAMRLYRAALVLTPKALSVRANMVECLLADEKVAAAEQEARAYVAIHPSAESWMLLGQVQQAMAKHDAALASANAAVQLAPTSRNVQFNYAGALDKVGRNKEALAVYRKLAAQSLESADLALALARALYADGEKKQAEAAVEQGLAKWPQSVALHSTLVRIRALRGEDENATALLEAEVAKRPDDLTLRLACADALHRGKHYTKALSVLETGLKLAPDNQGLLTAFGIVLDELDRPLDGLTALRRAAEVAGDAPASRRNMLSSLIRAGQPQEALRLLKPLRAAAPDEQYLIACEALALRVLGDPGYRALSDYDHHLRRYDIPAPRNFFTVENFNASFADVLRRQHRIAAHPLDQVLHKATQTPRTLLALDDPTLAAFKGSMDVAVRDYISRLKDDADDPVARRKKDRYRFAGLWSTRLAHEGYLPNQVHDRGWISGVYFVATSPAERPRDPHAGWLKLGEPHRPVGRCLAERVIEPKVGMLVLFPSYMWHGLIPFEGDEHLTASFDIVPA